MPPIIKFLFATLSDIYYKAGLFQRVAKKMADEKFCKSCPQSNKCQELYERVGKSKSPSVVLKVVFAFLLPLVVFIGCLAVFEVLSAKITDSEPLQMIFGLFLALLVTFGLMLITRVINKEVYF